MAEESEVHVQEPMLQLREFKKKDYRGVLALLVAAGYLALSVIALVIRPEFLNQILAADTLAILALEFYFRRNDNGTS